MLYWGIGLHLGKFISCFVWALDFIWTFYFLRANPSFVHIASFLRVSQDLQGRIPYHASMHKAKATLWNILIQVSTRKHLSSTSFNLQGKNPPDDVLWFRIQKPLFFSLSITHLASCRLPSFGAMAFPVLQASIEPFIPCMHPSFGVCEHFSTSFWSCLSFGHEAPFFKTFV